MVKPHVPFLRLISSAFRGMAEALSGRRHEIQKLHEDLRRSESLANLIVETAPNAIVVVNEEGQIERVNRRLEETFGYRRDELVGSSLEQLLPESLRAEHRRLRRGFVAEPAAREMGKGRDLYGRHKDGSEIAVEIGLAPMELEGRMRVVATITDIRVRKATAEEVRRLNAELEERVEQRTAELVASNRELEAFSYSVSHDLRAPLRAIDGYSRMLEEDHSKGFDHEGARLLGVVRRSAQMMAQLIDDLLAFSRVGRRALKLAQVDMGELARASFAEVQSMVDDKTTITFKLGDLPSAHVDPALFRQVWVNLLSNALKYSQGRADRVIEVTGACDGDRLRCEVRDNGVGFDMAYVDKLFGVFQRLHSVEEFEGTGVGLALVQRIVKRHGGDVWAEGRVGVGATFGFWLPAGQEDDE